MTKLAKRCKHQHLFVYFLLCGVIILLSVNGKENVKV